MSEIKNKIDKAHSFWKACSNVGYFVFPSSWVISSLILLPKYGHLSIWIGILVGLGFVGLWLIVYKLAFRRLINLYKEPKRSMGITPKTNFHSYKYLYESVLEAMEEHKENHLKKQNKSEE